MARRRLALMPTTQKLGVCVCVWCVCVCVCMLEGKAGIIM